jgi:hypothetical protein
MSIDEEWTFFGPDDCGGQFLDINRSRSIILDFTETIVGRSNFFDSNRTMI